jgi:ABC-type glycerol-3-phosphate transport system permease component
MLLLFVVFFSTSMVWAGLAYEHLEQYAQLSVAEQQIIYSAFTGEEWMAMLGDGLFFLVLFVSVCVAVVTTFLLCYVFVCYTEVRKFVPAPSAFQNGKIG